MDSIPFYKIDGKGQAPDHIIRDVTATHSGGAVLYLHQLRYNQGDAQGRWRIQAPDSNKAYDTQLMLSEAGQIQWSSFYNSSQRLLRNQLIMDSSQSRWVSLWHNRGDTFFVNEQSYPQPQVRGKSDEEIVVLVQDLQGKVRQKASWNADTVASSGLHCGGQFGSQYYFAAVCKNGWFSWQGERYEFADSGYYALVIFSVDTGFQTSPQVLDFAQTRSRIRLRPPHSGRGLTLAVTRRGEQAFIRSEQDTFAFENKGSNGRYWFKWDPGSNALRAFYSIAPQKYLDMDYFCDSTGHLYICDFVVDSMRYGADLWVSDNQPNLDIFDYDPVITKIDAAKRSVSWQLPLFADDIQPMDVPMISDLPMNRLAWAFSFKEDLQGNSFSMSPGGNKDLGVLILNKATGQIEEQYYARSDSSPVENLGHFLYDMSTHPDGHSIWLSGYANWPGSIQGVPLVEQVGQGAVYLWRVHRDQLVLGQQEVPHQHQAARTRDVIGIVPNPGRGPFELVLPKSLTLKSGSFIEVFTMLGQSVHRIPVDRSGLTKFEMDRPGMYWVAVEDQHGRRHTGRFVVR